MENRFDNIVLGAGAAGVAAACTAAREGAKTLLIEKYGFLGGLASSANVGTICGVYDQNFSTHLAGSFANQFLNYLETITGNKLQAVSFSNLRFVSYNPACFQAACDQLLIQAGVEVLLHCTCFGVNHHEDKLISLNVLSQNHPQTFYASNFIDASGEGLLTGLAKGEMITEELYQAPAFVMGLSGLRPESRELTERDLSLLVLKTLLSAEGGLIEAGSGYFSLVPASFRGDALSLKFALPSQLSLLNNDLSHAERYSRRTCLAAYQTLKNQLPIFKHSEISYLSPQIGVRSGPRGLGLYTLSTNDVLSAGTFNTAIANGLWPIEFWDGSRKALIKHPQGGRHFQIPAECLLSKSFSNLFLCGRGISADAQALSAARVIGTCLATGSAAGSLAASRLAGKAIEIAIKDYQKAEDIF